MYLITSHEDGSLVHRSSDFREIVAIFSPAVHCLYAFASSGDQCSDRDVYQFIGGAWKVFTPKATPAPIMDDQAVQADQADQPDHGGIHE